MALTPSTSVRDLPRSGIRRVFDEASKYPDCIRLEVGEPSFPTPEHVKRAAEAAMRDDFTKYTPNAGIPELREALAIKLRERNGIESTADDIVVTTGAVTSVFTTLSALVDPGDEVLVPDPSWPNYVQMTLLLGARPAHYSLALEDDLVPTPAAIEAAITPRSKVLILNSPGNPTGAVIGRDRLLKILDVARRHDLWVISDEVYDEIWFEEPPTSLQPLDTDGRVISVFSFSKTYAMTGWRVGYLVGPESIVASVLRTQEPINSCVNSIAQRAAIAAVTGDQTCVSEMRAAYGRRAALVTAILDAHGIPYATPRGAFYAMVDISRPGIPDTELISRLIHEERVAIVPGSAFGPMSGNFARISLASSEADLEMGVTRVARALTTW